MSVLKKTTPSEPSLKRIIHSKAAGMEPGRPNKIIHASRITSDREVFCPREMVLLDVLDLDPPGWFVGTSMRLTFDLGHATQEMITRNYLRDVALGNWECVVCRRKKSFCLWPPKCECGAPRECWHYVEIRVRSKYSGISCGLDLVIKFPHVKPRIYELKIIDKDYFIDLKSPKAEHRLRTSLYMRCLSESWYRHKDEIDQEVAGVLYVGRCFGKKDEEVINYPFADGGFSNLKEYTLARNDDITETSVQKGRLVHEVREGNALMPCGICKSKKDKRANQCKVKNACFSGDYPGQVTWLESGSPVHPKKEYLP